MGLSHAILVSILDKPLTGYQLSKRFGAVGYFWSASHQQIYGELKKLELAGLIVPATDAPGVRRDRSLTITDAGRTHLTEWVKAPTEPASIKEDILVKCQTLELISHRELANQITQRRSHHAARLKQYLVAATEYPDAQALDDTHLGRYLALSGGIAYEQQWVDWADAALKLLSKDR